VLRVALRGLMAHKGRMLTTFAAVALGVAFMGGVLVLTDTMNRSFDDLFADVFRDTDAVVRSSQTFDSDFGDVRGLIDADLLPEVESADGVRAAAGSSDGFAQIIDQQGDPVGDPAFGAPTFGTTWVDDDELNPFDLTDGRAPEADDEIVIDRKSAKDTGYEVGDTVPVQSPGGVAEFELVGIARFGTADSPGGASFVMWTEAAAMQWVGEEGRFSSISVAADDGVSQREVADSIDATLQDAGATGVQVITGEEITEETQSDIKQSLSFITTFFLVFAVIALVVGTFVIYNSFSIIVAQRTREMALLRAIGARRRQVRRAVLVEAVIVGLVGAAVGFVIGLGVATLLGSLLQVPGDTLAIVPSSVIVAVLTGVIVTVVSALLPAWRASRVPPLAAMREVAVDRTGRSRIRFVIGLAVLVAGLVTVIIGATGSTIETVGLGVALVFLGLILVCPGLARPVSRTIGAPVQRLRGASGRLARDNASRNPRRTSATAQALMIGVGLVALLLVINSSIRASIDKTLEDTFAGDFVVDSGSFGMIGLPPTVAADIEQIPDVSIVSPIRFSPAIVDGEDESVTGTNEGAFELLDMTLVDGDADLGPGEVVISQGTAEDRGISVGDEIPVNLVDDDRPESERTARVAGIYEAPESAPDLGPYVIGLDDFTAAAPSSSDAQIFVKIADGATIAQVEPELEQVVTPFAAADVLSVDEYKDSIKSQLNVFLLLLIALLLLSVVIAVLGIANTIALSVLERTRELGLLRAVGMRRRQVRATVRWEAVIISLYGTVLGLAFGLVGGWGLVRALRDEGFGVFEVPVVPFIAVALLGAFVGVLASVWPAWRASRMNVLDAIATE
jgi:putative ABC transport system permease protein